MFGTILSVNDGFSCFFHVPKRLAPQNGLLTPHPHSIVVMLELCHARCGDNVSQYI